MRFAAAVTRAHEDDDEYDGDDDRETQGNLADETALLALHGRDALNSRAL
jgi:hypothetical protein